MKKSIFALVLILLSSYSISSYSMEIAECSNPSGKAYYPEIGLITKKDAEWDQNEKITGGIVKLSKIGKNKYDILFVDATKRIISSVEDGGTVLMLSKGEKSVAFLVVYMGKTAEIFTFLTNTSGKSEYIHVTSRAGDDVMITKSSVMRGDCQYINFNALKN
jgi:hypothetical protein